MKTIIAGSRDFNDYKIAKEFLESFDNITEVISGGARGADKIGEQWAKYKQIPLKIFPAYWNMYGKSAGYRRNEQMAVYAEQLIAFWDGKSKGTMHMINIAKQRGLKVCICKI